MRFLLAATVATAIVAACVPVPANVEPTLSALRHLGLRCGVGHPDNVPSGLLQWSCDGLDRGVAVQVLVDGDDKGVFDVMALVPRSAGPATARDVFVDIVDGAPAFDAIRAGARRWLTEWSGAADDLTVGNGFLRVEQDASGIVLSAFPGPRRAVSDPI